MPNNDSNYIQTYNHPHGQVLINEQTLTDIADAIREQRLTDDTFKPAQFAGEIRGINEIEGGEYEGENDLSVEEKDVNFYDYDGTRVYSYGKEEFLSLSSLPDNPSHDNLVAQGWNWLLSDAKSYVQDYGILDVGQMYNTKNKYDTHYSNTQQGYLEIDIELKEGYLSPVLTLTSLATGTDASNMYISVFWGDKTYSGIGYGRTSVNVQHTYSSPGKYTIIVQESQLDQDNCKFVIEGTSSGSSLLTGGGTNDDIYRNCITVIRIGESVSTLGDYAFKNCNSLKTISLHKDLQNILSYNIFQNCYSLKNIIIPNNSTICTNGLNGETFLNCYSLEKVIFPKDLGLYDSNNNDMYSNFQNCYSLKNISLSEESNILPGGIFKECHSLKEINIPDSIISAENYIFQNCYSLKTINCYSTTPSSVTSTTFTGLPTYTKIYVPWSRDHSILQAYKTATYWSAIADQIYEMSMNENIQMYEAYAEFDSDEHTLTFFRDTPNKYTNGDTNETKTYYTGIETSHPTYSSGIPWSSKSSNIYTVIFENTIKPISTAYWFSSFLNLRSIIDLNKLNTSNVIDMKTMFYYCDDLTSLDVSNFNTLNVTNMSLMFDGCKNLTALDVSNFDTSKVTDMSLMFADCYDLTSLDVSNFNTSNVTNMRRMFYGCQSLISLDVSNFNTSKVTNVQSMFYDCWSLKRIYATQNWDLSNITSGSDMFGYCTNLSGNITGYSTIYTDYIYARLDNPPNNPGYFTDISQPIDERAILRILGADNYNNSINQKLDTQGNINQPTGTITVKNYTNGDIITTWDCSNITPNVSRTISLQTESYFSNITNGTLCSAYFIYSGDENYKPTITLKSFYKYGNQITFKISYNSTVIATKTAMEGMTFEQFCDAALFNTDFYFSPVGEYGELYADGDVYLISNGHVWDSEDTYYLSGVDDTDKIINNTTYTMVYWYDSCCFEANTQILTPEGTKSIQDIDIGDTITLQNSSTGERTTTTALKVANIHYPTRKRAIVEFADGKELRYNPYHPIWTTNGYKTLGHYKDYSTLEVGDTVVLQDNTTTTVTNITIENIPGGDLTTYNLLLAGVDDYYLEDEQGYFANDILVHHGVVNYYNEDEYRARHADDCVNKVLYENFDFDNSTDEEIINFIVELHSQSEDAYNEYMKYYLTAAQYRKFVTLYPEIKRRINKEVSS